jgi:hypothetical protein
MGWRVVPSRGNHHVELSMAKFGFFRDSELATDCDECGGRVDVVKGGACVRCRRILCFTHLHGSFARRLATDLGAAMLCVRCRAGEAVGIPDNRS